VPPGPEVDGTVLPLALAPAGDEVILRVQRGARSRLLRHHLASGATSWIHLPAGRTLPAAAWPRHGPWLAHCTPATPTTLWWQPPGAGAMRRAGTGRYACPPVSVTTLPGAAGAVEVVRYGADWRAADRVVVALHGGPSEHWDLGFYGHLRWLASAGLVIVAPNQRGSTGYGREHEYAIRGAWGGPDLEDLLAIGRHLRAVRGPARRPPALLGTSYGAFLGLLAVACAPELWSSCVAVAPFVSGARLCPDAGSGVRALLDRLHGTVVLDDHIGPRDLVRLAPRMRGRILVAHGEHDPVIPVSHSREIVAALRDVSGVDLAYREEPGRGHLLVNPGSEALLAEILRVLAGGACRPDRSPEEVNNMELELEALELLPQEGSLTGGGCWGATCHVVTCALATAYDDTDYEVGV
jgi:pimeloyl-ACP methyl ester carboxylesterase